MTSQPWFRAYGELIDDAKLRLLAFEDRWHYVALLCCKSQGLLEDTKAPLLDRVIGLKLGLASRELDEVRRRLMDVDLIDAHWQPLGWDRRQFVSDNSASRTRKWRERKTSPTPPPEESKTKTDTDTEGDVTSDVTVTSQQRVTIGMPIGVNQEALGRWETWLRFKGKPVNDLSRPAIARRLVSFGDAERQSEVVEHSVSGQYLQLYPPKPDLGHLSGTAGKPRARPKTADEYEQEYLRAQQ